MALFFDQSWFDARLADAGLTRAALAAALGLAPDDIAAMWKDQREISAGEVAAIAALIGAEPAEVARRAGISTPVPVAAAGETPARLAAIEARLDRLERLIVELKTLILAAR